MVPDGGSSLSRTSSLVVSSPTKSGVPGKRIGKPIDIVPGSKEKRGRKTCLYKGEIIDLSSESDGKDTEENLESPYFCRIEIPLVNSDPIPGSPSSPTKLTNAIKLPRTTIRVDENEDDSDVQPHYLPKADRSRRTVVSDSEDETGGHNESEIGNFAERTGEVDDGSTLVFSDPSSSRSPIPRESDSPMKPKERIQRPVAVHPKGTPSAQTRLPDFFQGSRRSKGDKDSDEAPGSGATGVSSSTGTTPTTPAPIKPTLKRRTKKVLEQEKQAQLATYAQALFNELNESVFRGRLPKDTPLVWNKRLLATAGRAKWHRDSKGAVTTSIELATKVLDCEERIRNTLSHEMCHLACWVINCNPKENHGGVWRGWVEEVMEKRPDIVIATKHSYDIQYKYEWQCQTPTCKRTYGRFSKSIDPGKSICGACKTGELKPLFQKRTRTTKAISKLAATKTQDSPVSGSPRRAEPTATTPLRLKTVLDDSVIFIVSDSNSDRESPSDADTDIVAETKINAPVALRPDGPRDDARKREVQNDTSVINVHKLITHMSIIDLTDD